MNNKAIREILYYGSLYSVCVGVLYLWGYWWSFGISILEFMSLADIIKTSAYPILSSFIIVVIGVVFNELSYAPLLPEGEGRYTKTGQFLIRHQKAIGTLYMLIIMMTLLIHFDTAKKCLILSLLVPPPVSFFLKKYGLLKYLIPQDGMRRIVIFLLVFLPFSAYSYGKIRANEILTGNDYKYVKTDVLKDTKATLGLGNYEKLKYLGYINNHLFFLSPDNRSVVIIAFDKIPGLKLESSK